MNDTTFKKSTLARDQLLPILAQRIIDGSYFDDDTLMVSDDFSEACDELEKFFSPSKPTHKEKSQS